MFKVFLRVLAVLLRVLAVVLAGAATIPAFFAAIFRIESMAEASAILRLDLGIGLAFGLAFLLWRIPKSWEDASANRAAVTALGALLDLGIRRRGVGLLARSSGPHPHLAPRLESAMALVTGGRSPEDQ